LPARSRIPAITGALVEVLIVVANGDSPLRSTCFPGDLGVPVGGALLAMAVHRAQQRVDVDEGLPLDPGQHIGALGQRDQVLAQHRFELAGMTEAELPQQRPQGRGRVHPVEQDGHPTRAQHIEVIDAVRAGAHSGDHAQQLGHRVRRPRPNPRRLDRHLLGDDLRQPGLLGQPEHRHQPRERHEIVLIEVRGAGGKPMRHSHWKCPSRAELICA